MEGEDTIVATHVTVLLALIIYLAALHSHTLIAVVSACGTTMAFLMLGERLVDLRPMASAGRLQKRVPEVEEDIALSKFSEHTHARITKKKKRKRKKKCVPSAAGRLLLLLLLHHSI